METEAPILVHKSYQSAAAPSVYLLLNINKERYTNVYVKVTAPRVSVVRVQRLVPPCIRVLWFLTPSALAEPWQFEWGPRMPSASAISCT